MMGARVRRVALAPDAAGAWRLDVQSLVEAITPKTTVLLVNSPNNPTGWTLTRDEQQALLAHCRRTGTWIVADEVYERMWFGGGACAPSFLDLATSDDRLIVVHSFSKSFLMTGWRLGWMVVPDGVVAQIGKLIEFNTSCAPEFVQHGGLAALALGDTFVDGVGAAAASLPRPAARTIAAVAGRDCRHPRRRAVRVLEGRRADRFVGAGQAAGRRTGPRLGARHRFRAGGRGLAALVFRVP